MPEQAHQSKHFLQSIPSTTGFIGFCNAGHAILQGSEGTKGLTGLPCAQALHFVDMSVELFAGLWERPFQTDGEGVANIQNAEVNVEDPSVGTFIMSSRHEAGDGPRPVHATAVAVPLRIF